MVLVATSVVELIYGKLVRYVRLTRKKKIRVSNNTIKSVNRKRINIGIIKNLVGRIFENKPKQKRQTIKLIGHQSTMCGVNY